MSLPRFFAGDDGFFRFGPELADWASLMVAMELDARGADKPSQIAQRTWVQLFNETVRPKYGERHTAEQLGELERQLRVFIRHTVANHLQICKMRTWRGIGRRN